MGGGEKLRVVGERLRVVVRSYGWWVRGYGWWVRVYGWWVIGRQVEGGRWREDQLSDGYQFGRRRSVDGRRTADEGHAASSDGRPVRVTWWSMRYRHRTMCGRQNQVRIAPKMNKEGAEGTAVCAVSLDVSGVSWETAAQGGPTTAVIAA